jgi:hypothetical protein
MWNWYVYLSNLSYVQSGWLKCFENVLGWNELSFGLEQVQKYEMRKYENARALSPLVVRMSHALLLPHANSSTLWLQY